MGDAIYQDWENNSHVEILHVLDEINQPYSCNEWGDGGLNGIPPIIIGESSTFLNLFEHPGDGTSRPLVVFINHEMEIIFISDNHVTQTDANDLINLMLENCGDNCDGQLSTININNYPEEFQIQRPYPNPFNPVLNININIAWAGMSQVSILDISGNHINTLYSGYLHPGSHQMRWNGESLPSGVYFISLQSSEKNLIEKVVLLK